MKTVHPLFIFLTFLFNWQAATACQTTEDFFTISGCNITAQKSYDGKNYGQVNLKAYLPPNRTDHNLDSMVLILSGYDIGANPEDANDLSPSITSDQYANSAEAIRLQGYTLLVLNFGKTTGYVQNSAYAFIQALETLNRLSPGQGNKIPVVGVSLGGVIARYALAWMEQNHLEHQVGLTISLDSPHQGANIPVGIQRVPGFMASAAAGLHHEIEDLKQGYEDLAILYATLTWWIGGVGVLGGIATFSSEMLFGAVADVFVDPILEDVNRSYHMATVLSQQTIESITARQLLINYHANDGADPLHTQWLSELAQMGYPKLSRNVAITCGSVHGKKQADLDQNTVYLTTQTTQRHIEDVPKDLYLSLGPVNTTVPGQLAFQAEMKGPGVCSDFWDYLTGKMCTTSYYRDTFYAAPHHIALDDAPGGYQFFVGETLAILNANLKDEGYQPDLISYGDIMADGKHAFIPTSSALDIVSFDYHQDLLALSGNQLASITPFDAVYYPQEDKNYEHPFCVTDEVMQSLLQEIKEFSQYSTSQPILSTTQSSFPATGGSASLSVKIPDTSITWTTTTEERWIHLADSEPKTGDGTLDYTVDENPDPSQRTGILSVGEAKLTITQAGCTVEKLSPHDTSNLAATGDTFTLDIQTDTPHCRWNLSSNASWLIPTLSTGEGGQTVNYQVDLNETLITRSASLTAGNQSITLYQSGNSPYPEVTLSPLTSSTPVEDTVEVRKWRYYQIITTSMLPLVVKLSDLSANIDLYVQKETLPTRRNYRCRSLHNGITEERCLLLPTTNDSVVWYIGVYGYRPGSFTVTAGPLLPSL